MTVDDTLLLQDFAASVLMALESWTLNAESTNAGLTTPLDAQVRQLLAAFPLTKRAEVFCDDPSNDS